MIKRLKLLLWGVVGLGLAALSAVLVMDNATPVSLRLLTFETAPAPVFVWLFIALGCGVVGGFALASFSVLKGKVAQRQLRRERDRSDRELGRLRQDTDSE